MFFLFLIYPGVSATVMRTFVCRDVDGISLLEADYRLECFNDEWTQYALYAAGMALVYPIGIPFVVFIKLYTYYDVIIIDVDDTRAKRDEALTRLNEFKPLVTNLSLALCTAKCHKLPGLENLPLLHP